jgi:hypothetical protein
VILVFLVLVFVKKFVLIFGVFVNLCVDDVPGKFC